MQEQVSSRLSGTAKFSKWVIIALNLLAIIFACILISVGSVALNSKVGSLSGNTLPSGIIVLGVFLLIISLVGAVAAFKESRGALGVYFGFLTLICILIFFVSIAVFVKKDSAESLMRDGWQDAANDVRINLQDYYECCGLETVTNSTGAVDYTYKGIPCNPDYKRSCLSLMVKSFQDNYKQAGGCGIAFAVLLVAALVLIYVLMRGIKKRAHFSNMDENDIQQSADNDSFGPSGSVYSPNNASGPDPFREDDDV